MAVTVTVAIQSSSGDYTVTVGPCQSVLPWPSLVVLVWCQSIPDSQCNSRATHVRVSLTVTVTLTIPGCPGTVTHGPPMSEYP